MLARRAIASIILICIPRASAFRGNPTRFYRTSTLCMQSKPALLSVGERQVVLPQISSWSLVASRDGIERTFMFTNFVQAFGFMSQVAIVVSEFTMNLSEPISLTITFLFSNFIIIRLLRQRSMITTQNFSTFTIKSAFF